MSCIGYTDKTFTIPCPEPVTCEVRAQRDGIWGSWLPVCGQHADSALEVMNETEGWAAERRDLCPECAGELGRGMRELGTEVTVSTSPPVVAGPYTTEPFVCPHGVTYWIEPTGEQIARWVAEGVR